MRSPDFTWRKKYDPPQHEKADYMYQKRIEDNKWTKYFINCKVNDMRHVTNREWIAYTFSAQFEKDERCIEVSTVQRFTDPQEKYRPYPTIQEVEYLFEKMRVAYGGEYYELNHD